MAGLFENIVLNRKPKVSDYLIELLEKAKREHGVNSSEYLGIYNQYFNIPDLIQSKLTNLRHYDAEIHQDGVPRGLERLYKRSIVIDLLSSCAGECLFCLRGYYPKFVLNNNEINEIATYCSKDPYLKEVLITGGDPFIAPNKLKQLITELAYKANNIKIIRIGTRLPVQNPEQFDETFNAFFKALSTRFIFEIACQINHYYELQDKPKEIFKRLRDCGCYLYSQNVLLKGVNDDIEVLTRLYDELRYLGIMPHYLFHAIPMKGTDSFRTSVQRGIDLIMELTSSGQISGRTKPQYTLMTDVGKVTLYEGTILNREGNFISIKTKYKLEDRIKWIPNYILPASAILGKDGNIVVKYLDSQ